MRLPSFTGISLRSTPWHSLQTIDILASAGADGSVRLWDVEAGRPFANVSGTVSDPWTLAISADGRLLAAINGDGMVRMWDVASGRRTGKPLRNQVQNWDLLRARWRFLRLETYWRPRRRPVTVP